ncbi:MAG: glycosyltransferase [Thermoanaerobaculia bacterium]|nr:glycosyltransferase [Thermoanaerobaculia bacterium]
MTGSGLPILVAYYLLLIWLVVYSLHRFYLIRLIRRSPLTSRRIEVPSLWPSVTVQLPVYNERFVVRRLIRAAANLDYPGSLVIQVLDDSTDDTTAIIRRELAALSDSRIVHVRRDKRSGYKAGALAFGMERSSSELYAVFDADFVPNRDFLLRTVPQFCDSEVGMVQARWGHLNRRESLLTRLQALYLDAHFGVESAARHRAGLFFNFNGTAGVWRREAIESAGGWSATTVTEDLDLSYRAQRRGWKFTFLSDTEVPAELPNTLTAFHGQQFRWAKGSLQTARLHVGAILRSTLPWRVKMEALFHLTNNSAYLLTLILGLLLVPSIMIRYASGLSWILGLDALLFLTSTASLIAFYREGQRQIGQPLPKIREVIWLIPFGIGLSVTNARAVIEGLTRRGGVFNRTLKQGSAGIRITESRPPIRWSETILSLYFASTTLLILAQGIVAPIPFIALFLVGYGSTAVLAFAERAEHRHATSTLGERAESV